MGKIKKDVISMCCGLAFINSAITLAPKYITNEHIIEIEVIKKIDFFLKSRIELKLFSDEYSAIYLIDAVSRPNFEIKVKILSTIIAKT